MAGLPPDPDTGDDTGVRPTADRPPSTPRWVKVFGIIVGVVVLLVVAVMFIGGGEHGPGRHTPSGDAGGQVPPSSVMEDHAPPEGGRG
jgi:hypothetical protein